MKSGAVKPQSEPFSVLLVCTGNVCRSPIAEQLLVARLSAAGVAVTAGSAGTRALVGHPMTLEAAEQVAEHGVTPSPHRARQLTAKLVEKADLILTASRDHRGEVVSLAPSASRHTFTLREFARIIASADAPAARPAPAADGVHGTALTTALMSYVDLVAGARGYAPPPALARDDDIDDPYRQSRQVYRRSASAIDEAVTTIVAGLASARGAA